MPRASPGAIAFQAAVRASPLPRVSRVGSRLPWGPGIFALFPRRSHHCEAESLSSSTSERIGRCASGGGAARRGRLCRTRPGPVDLLYFLLAWAPCLGPTLAVPHGRARTTDIAKTFGPSEGISCRTAAMSSTEASRIVVSNVPPENRLPLDLPEAAPDPRDVPDRSAALGSLPPADRDTGPGRVHRDGALFAPRKSDRRQLVICQQERPARKRPPRWRLEAGGLYMPNPLDHRRPGGRLDFPQPHKAKRSRNGKEGRHVEATRAPHPRRGHVDRLYRFAVGSHLQVPASDRGQGRVVRFQSVKQTGRPATTGRTIERAPGQPTLGTTTPIPASIMSAQGSTGRMLKIFTSMKCESVFASAAIPLSSLPARSTRTADFKESRSKSTD